MSCCLLVLGAVGIVGAILIAFAVWLFCGDEKDSNMRRSDEYGYGDFDD